MSKRRKCRRSFFFSCRAVTVVSKVGSAVTWDTRHLQDSETSKGTKHINPAGDRHYVADQPTASFRPVWSAGAGPGPAASSAAAALVTWFGWPRSGARPRGRDAPQTHAISERLHASRVLRR